ncbi:fibronectin type III domain-containing protein [Nonomuraea sp. NPDC059023]|uniref:fibronectin type III domain-containing protein n=1 Tax=unclassified Nonomuraea TaxID=2593643 RepID=UPI003686A8B4
MTVPAGATSVTFKVKISTEGTPPDNLYDPFIFFVGAAEKYRMAGEHNWHQPGTYDVTGATQVTFRYTRDSSADAGSNAVWIDEVTFDVTPPDPTPPTAPPNVRVTSMSPSDFALAWDAATDNVAVTGYGVYKDGVKQGGDAPGLTRALTGLTAATSYTLAVDAVDAAGNRSPQTSITQQTPGPPAGGDAGRTRTFVGLTPGQTYLVEVDAVDTVGNRSAKASLSASTDADPPTVPGNLRVTSVSGTQISVAWDASTDAVTGVAGYGVYLGSVQVEDVHPGLGWTFGSLTPGQTYLVEVDAVDGAGHRSATASLSVQAEVDVSPPTVPGNLRVTGGSPYTLDVTWDASTDPGGLAGYGVYVDSTKQGPDQLPRVRAFTGLTPSTTYLVEVDAADASGNRSLKAQLTHVTPADLPPAPPGNLRSTAVSYTGWTVAWDPAVDDVQVTGYDITVNGAPAATNAAVLTHSMSGLPDDTPYVVRVWAVDHIGQRSTAAAELTVTTLDDTDPTTPSLTTEAGENTIAVAWGASSDDFGVVGYEVLLDGEVVHTTPGVDYTVDGPVERRHVIESLGAGVPYTVRVAAVDTLGQRSADNSVVVATDALPYQAIETPVYRIGDWAANVRDGFGVDWVVEAAEGWSSSPPVSPVSADRGGVDGVRDGAGRYGPRRVVLAGVAIAPTRMAMLAAKQRFARLLHPAGQEWLRVIDARMERRARARVDDRSTSADQGSLGFRWRVTLKIADPRRYATTPVRALAVVASLPGEAAMTVQLNGTYPTIPARMRLYGPIKNFTITHEESGTVMRAMPGTVVPADTRYSYTIDLSARQVWAHVPPEVWPVARPGRSALAHLPAWWHLIPGTNTITLAGEPVPGQPGTPRLALEAYDAWS